MRIPDGSSVLTAEAKAINLALDFIDSCFLYDKFLIYSDISVLKALNHTSSKHSQIQKLLEKHHQITDTKETLFCWLPSHVDIIGNEIADRKAKDSLKLNMSTFEVPFNNFKPLINKCILSECIVDLIIFFMLKKSSDLQHMDLPRTGSYMGSADT